MLGRGRGVDGEFLGGFGGEGRYVSARGYEDFGVDYIADFTGEIEKGDCH